MRRGPVNSTVNRLRERDGMAYQRRRRAFTTVVVTLLTAVVSACSPGGSAGGGAPAHSAGGPGAETSTSQGPRVAAPWKPGQPQLGVNVYWDDNPADAENVVRAKADRLLDYIIGLGANSIALAFPFDTQGPTANAVFAETATPSPARVGIVLDEARRCGVRATVRPLLDERSLQAVNSKNWRGAIKPTNRDRWFASYQQFLAPYLKVARASHAATFFIGSELNSLEGDPHWKTLVAQAANDFDGEITYGENWDSFGPTPADVPVKSVAIDAYPPVDVNDDAPVSSLVAGWNNWLDRKASGAQPDTLLSEVGAPAEAGAYRKPWGWGDAAKPVNLTVQTRWFDAACQVARERKTAGLYWWKLDFHTDPAAADPQHDVHDSFVARPSAQVIKSCFSAWSQAS
jgi:hypothetical protein